MKSSAYWAAPTLLNWLAKEASEEHQEPMADFAERIGFRLARRNVGRPNAAPAFAPSLMGEKRDL
jgi:hypothetical protein